MQLFNYGLNYNIEKQTATYFTSLIAETERAIKLLDAKTKNKHRFLPSNNQLNQPKRYTKKTPIYDEKTKPKASNRKCNNHARCQRQNNSAHKYGRIFQKNTHVPRDQ